MFYLFHGPDEFTMREELTRLRSGGGFELSQDIYPGGEVSLATITATCDTLPFLSARRFVVVDGLPKRRRASKEQEAAPGDQSGDRGAGATAPVSAADGRSRKGGTRPKGGAGSGADPKAFTQGLAEYVRHLPETSVLVVLADEELEASHPLLLAAQRFGQARAFLAPKGAQLETWLAQRAAAVHAQLAPDAARLLASYVGADLRQLASELEKLSTYVGDNNVISAEVVRLLTPTTQQARIFDLTDALARRDRPRALALLYELLEAGESALGIVALTAHQTRSLIQVKALAERGLRPVQIAQTAGMAPFLVDKSLALARQFTGAQLIAAHHALLEVDTALKLSKLTPEMALDLFVVEFGL